MTPPITASAMTHSSHDGKPLGRPLALGSRSILREARSLESCDTAGISWRTMAEDPPTVKKPPDSWMSHLLSSVEEPGADDLLEHAEIDVGETLDVEAALAGAVRTEAAEQRALGRSVAEHVEREALR